MTQAILSLTEKCSFSHLSHSFLDLWKKHSLPGVTWTSVKLGSYSSILNSFGDDMDFDFGTPSTWPAKDRWTFYQSQVLSLIGQIQTDFGCFCSCSGLHSIQLLAWKFWSNLDFPFPLLWVIWRILLTSVTSCSGCLSNFLFYHSWHYCWLQLKRRNYLQPS